MALAAAAFNRSQRAETKDLPECSGPSKERTGMRSMR